MRKSILELLEDQFQSKEIPVKCPFTEKAPAGVKTYLVPDSIKAKLVLMHAQQNKISEINEAKKDQKNDMSWYNATCYRDGLKYLIEQHLRINGGHSENHTIAFFKDWEYTAQNHRSE